VEFWFVFGRDFEWNFGSFLGGDFGVILVMILAAVIFGFKHGRP
jgi:hypothetical protein